jgi:hypothetical protein
MGWSWCWGVGHPMELATMELGNGGNEPPNKKIGMGFRGGGSNQPFLYLRQGTTSIYLMLCSLHV